MSILCLSTVVRAANLSTCITALSFLNEHSTAETLIYPFSEALEGGRSVESLSRYSDPLIKDRFMNFASTTWYDPNALYIGIANHPSEGTAHFYLIAGNLRLDGQYGATHLRKEEAGKVPYATKGIVFKLSTSPTLRDRVQDLMRQAEGKNSANCVEPILDVLGASGIGVQATYTDTGFASPTALAGNLFINSVSYGNDRIAVHLMMSSNEELKYFLSTLPGLDRSISNQLSRRAPSALK